MSFWSKTSPARQLKTLKHAVYPPEEETDWPGNAIDWSSPQFGIGIWDPDLISYAGLQTRDARHDGRPVRIGGVGGVATHPEHRGRGHARRCLATADRFFRAETDAEFALLVCAEGLVPYYSDIGWSVFDGTLLVRQDGDTVELTFNLPMVADVAARAPRAGVIDLEGPPW